MMTDVMEQNGEPVRTERSDVQEHPLDVRTGTQEPDAAARIVAIRERIDEIDQALIDLWQERAGLSQQVGRTRMASGGTRLVLSREQAILERFRAALGADGVQLALLLLRAGRGPL
ncbi:chorismate mutase [Micromonospora sp. WMMD882]|uniref:chorismate mutase n=1 Tax=Micromonospora sp. WMMD882 TaxID=3015151 RepID=UPI00248B14B3|nr:chorismate mutase [Micromonospora sp. WMMD882]WBB79258.1 chorismate mutase [Micromonospora sp. WMMD882]